VRPGRPSRDRNGLCVSPSPELVIYLQHFVPLLFAAAPRPCFPLRFLHSRGHDVSGRPISLSPFPTRRRGQLILATSLYAFAEGQLKYRKVLFLLVTVMNCEGFVFFLALQQPVRQSSALYPSLIRGGSFKQRRHVPPAPRTLRPIPPYGVLLSLYSGRACLLGLGPAVLHRILR